MIMNGMRIERSEYGWVLITPQAERIYLMPSDSVVFNPGTPVAVRFRATETGVVREYVGNWTQPSL